MKSFYLSYFINFEDLDQLDNSYYKNTLINLSKKFGKIYLVNIGNITGLKKNSNNYKFNNTKFFELINPKNLTELNIFLKDKKIVVLHSIMRTLNNLPLLILLKFNDVKLVELSNLGNIQIGTEYFVGAKSIRSFRHVFIKNLIKKIFNILAILKIISKVECKFVSNKKIYKNFKNKSKLNKFFSYYKDIIFVKSNIYEIESKKKIIEKYIVLIDIFPLYGQFTDYMKVDNSKLKNHYSNLNKLLNYLSKILKKKVIVCIHPKYPISVYKKFLPNKKVIKYMTEKYIEMSHVVLQYNSSAILCAIKHNKKIISVQAEVFKGIKYSSSIYQERLGTEVITLKKEYTINRDKLIKQLNKRVKNYSNYKKLYFGTENKNLSSKDIGKYLTKFNN